MNKIIFTFVLVHLTSIIAVSQHPCLTLTKEGVEVIKLGMGNTPLFDQKIKSEANEVDEQIALGISVPVPKDMGGGYSHERHKYNCKLMHKAGNLFQFTGDEKYAIYVKEMLMQYADMFPELPLHPTNKSYATGKLFWQSLNDAHWLVFTSQAYDCIYDFLSQEERIYLEKDLFLPYANFLSEENPRFFNRIHNHSTWANAAVGMIALVMGNDTLLDKALFGLKDDGINPEELDNDGGYIKRDGVWQAGFLAQLDFSFSPDGYFAEGPYYQRYAIFPFLVFSQALHNNRPKLKIFEYRDGILLKATKSLVQLTDPSGNFFPINDAQKGMNFKAYELVTAIDLMYFINKEESELLAWAALQDNVAFNEAGFFVAKQLEKGGVSMPVKSSVLYTDGIDGDEGAVAILRMEEVDLLFKFASHGMGHGHFDRLSYALYDVGGEVVQDYGAVRWVNLDQKAGGRYLPENKTFGKQTIGHNTATVNQSSQFEGSIRKAEKSSPKLYFKDFEDANVKIASAIENNAFENVNMQRVLILMKDAEFENPITLDIFALSGTGDMQVDLPFWYCGQLMKTSFDCRKDVNGLTALGSLNGYQHIWKEGSSELKTDQFSFNWFGNNRFYTLTSASESGDEVILGKLGANDPNFNLRSDPVLVHRKLGNEKVIYFNVLESHGNYSTVTETPSNPYGSIEAVEVLYKDENYVICSFTTAKYQWTVSFALKDDKQKSKHKVTVGEMEYSWTGVYNLLKSKI